ncbi:MAG: VWA domain-containing protein [Sporomusaceae bacterium]|nr:VWA domain-containing protein [Sporomusaceae bacterium]
MLFRLAIDLYNEIEKRGLHIRKDGRDTQWYNQLRKRFNCPPNIGLKTHFRNKKVSAADFIKEFFEVTEPFSLMYFEIFSIMKEHQVTKAGSESDLKIECDFGTKGFKIDLADFQEWVRIERTIKGSRRHRLWTEYDVWQLTDFFGMLGVDSRDENLFYPIQIPPPESKGYLELDKCIQDIFYLLTAIAKRISAGDDGRCGTNPFEIIDDNPLSDNFIHGAFSIILARYKAYLLQDDLNNIERAIAFFHDHILSNLTIVHMEEEDLIDEFINILNLPFWKNRWYLYEIWVTLTTLRALNKYKVKLNDKSGVLPLKTGSFTNVATFQVDRGDKYSILAQLKTDIKGYPGRKGIEPDIRFVENSSTKAEHTKIIIECKQRMFMRSKDLEENACLYEYGAPNSIMNFFVNYDCFPSIASPKLTKTEFFSKVRPSMTGEFTKALLNELAHAGILPASNKFDAILVDRSLSMGSDNEYNEETKEIIFKIIRKYRIDNKFYFGSEFIDASSMEPEEFVRNIYPNMGVDMLGEYFKLIRDKYPDVKKILLLTDGEYNPNPLPQDIRVLFDITEYRPSQLVGVKEFQ